QAPCRSANTGQARHVSDGSRRRDERAVITHTKRAGALAPALTSARCGVVDYFRWTSLVSLLQSNPQTTASTAASPGAKLPGTKTMSTPASARAQQLARQRPQDV